MFSFIKDKIKKIYSGFTHKASSIFKQNKLDDQFLKELSDLLIQADTGYKTTENIILKLKNDIKNTTITTLDQVKEELIKLLTEELKTNKKINLMPKVLLLVGINGSGKTTFAAKYAIKLKSLSKKVLLVAGDTFRAAAVQQLNEWGNKINVEVFIGKPNQDPASVIFDACKKFQDENFDHIIIDTAGRLQTKVNLMNELEKIRRVIGKILPEQEIHTWLTIDSMLGQNSLKQAEVFNQATKVDGLILTKLDGTGKGGVVFSIVHDLNLPILYLTFGEDLNDIKAFDANEYVQGLFSE